MRRFHREPGLVQRISGRTRRRVTCGVMKAGRGIKSSTSSRN
jgi:hypothetical protein